ncbi:alanine dehydrogenase [Nocardioides baekrokdamisoli]|nr:alanine dehydrogenase [Nocardioides baekrokdamisoli]
MRIGVPKELKNHEYRVAITPAGVHALVSRGHTVTVQAGAGIGSSISDDDFRAAGAQIEPDPDKVWAEAELVLKVKEPIAEEYSRLRPGLVLFTYLHLAADEHLTKELLANQVTALAYETVELADRSLPLLAPMSEVAGRLAPQVGAATLQRANGGRGVLLGGVPGVKQGKVVILGAGVSGLNAARIATGMGADVAVLDVSVPALHRAEQIFGSRIQTIASSPYAIEEQCLSADLVIGAVLVAGAKAPRLVSNDLVRRMLPGSVLVDIAIDQGGCFEDSRPTTHADPTFRVHDSVFYCVTNMPGAVPNTSTYALTNVTLPYVTAIADRGWEAALRNDSALARGLNTHAGLLTNLPVGTALGLDSTDPESVLG